MEPTRFESARRINRPLQCSQTQEGFWISLIIQQTTWGICKDCRRGYLFDYIRNNWAIAYLRICLWCWLSSIGWQRRWPSTNLYLFNNYKLDKSLKVFIIYPRRDSKSNRIFHNFLWKRISFQKVRSNLLERTKLLGDGECRYGCLWWFLDTNIANRAGLLWFSRHTGTLTITSLVWQLRHNEMVGRLMA